MATPRYNRQTLPVYAAQQPTTGRIPRRPKHPFYIESRPWQIVPMCFAPVLPGETLKNLLLQSRVVSDPVKNKLIGWWNEYYFFYVKHRDLLQDEQWAGETTYRQHLIDMVLNPAAVAPAAEAADAKYYHPGGSVNWLLHAVRSVVYHWFRDQTDASAQALDGYYAASFASGSGVPNVMDSLMLDSAVPTTDIPETGDMTDLDKAYQTWEFMRGQGLMKMDYEDFLRTYGISAGQAAAAVDKPELIRYVREWSYPTNTVEPTTGVPTSALTWSVQERADKDRFFTEPGWIVGVTVKRPKGYYAGQTGSVCNLMQDAFAWLPAVAQEDYAASLRQFAEGTGAFPAITSGTTGYWIDFRDLYVYGEQFRNVASGYDSGGAILPDANGQARYPALGDAQGIFVNDEALDTLQYVREDGIVQLHILGRQADMT